MAGEPTKFENDTLHMAFTSETLMDKIAKASNQSDVLKAMEKVFEKKISLNLEIKKVTLNPDKPKKEKNDKPSIIEMAEEVFGIKSE